MRRVAHDDRGAAAIILVLCMGVLLVAMALSVDVGSAVAGHRSAQNSADASALAVATDCSRTGAVSSAAPYLKTGQVAQLPSDCGGGSVTVKVTKTQDYTAGKVAGLDNYNVSGSATAKWGALGSQTGTFPITISTCAFTIAFNVKVTLHSHNTAGCSNPAGQFGFIQGGCTNQTIVAGQNLSGTTGNNLVGTGCTEASLNALLGKDVLVPVWDTATGTGAGAQYHILAYAVFNLTGWSTNGNNAGTPPSSLKKQCDASADGGLNEHDNTPCIRGVFKGFTTQSGTVVPGLTCNNNLLACQVYLDH
jgi:Flp pilus assembly protein TadG